MTEVSGFGLGAFGFRLPLRASASGFRLPASNWTVRFCCRVVCRPVLANPICTQKPEMSGPNRKPEARKPSLSSTGNFASPLLGLPVEGGAGVRLQVQICS